MSKKSCFLYFRLVNCLFYRARNWSHKLCDKSFVQIIILLYEAVIKHGAVSWRLKEVFFRCAKNPKRWAYVGNVRLQFYDSRHLFSDEGFVDGQPTVSADQLSQVNHELLIGLARLSKTKTFLISCILALFYQEQNEAHWFDQKNQDLGTDTNTQTCTSHSECNRQPLSTY